MGFTPPRRQRRLCCEPDLSDRVTDTTGQGLEEEEQGRKKWQDSEEMCLGLQWLKACVREFMWGVKSRSGTSDFTRVPAASMFMKLAVGRSPVKPCEAFFKGCCLSAVLHNTQYQQKHAFLPISVRWATAWSPLQSQIYQHCGLCLNLQNKLERTQLACCITGLERGRRNTPAPKTANNSAHQTSSFIKEITSEQDMPHTRSAAGISCRWCISWWYVNNSAQSRRAAGGGSVVVSRHKAWQKARRKLHKIHRANLLRSIFFSLCGELCGHNRLSEARQCSASREKFWMTGEKPWAITAHQRLSSSQGFPAARLLV